MITREHAMITIEHGIPIPQKTKYPLEQLAIGDSFLCPKTTKSKNITSLCVAYSKKTGFKYTVRKVEDGLRVWRIK